MTFLFMVDASEEIGLGHFSRCFNFAIHLKKINHKVFFYGQKFSQAARKKLLDSNISFFESNFLDIVFAKKIRSKIKPEWIIYDNYEFNAIYESQLSSVYSYSCVIDDLANRKHNCEILIDQNFVKNYKNRYNGLVGKSTKLLLGPTYALIGESYKKAQLESDSKHTSTKNILISFGSSDQTNATSKSLKAFLKLDPDKYSATVVLSRNSDSYEKLREKINLTNNVTLKSDLQSLATEIKLADLVIGNCGVSALERISLGKYSIVLTLADNQKPMAEYLNHKKVIHWLGDNNKVNEESIFHAIQNAFKLISKKTFKDSINSFKKQVNINGVDSLTREIIRVSNQKLSFKEVDFDDADLLLNWANNSDTRAKSFNNSSISMDEHILWLRKKILDTRVFFLIAYRNEIPIGTIRFEKFSSHHKFEIHYTVSPNYRSMGYGKKIVREGIQYLIKNRECNGFAAKVRSTNLASIKIFGDLGFDLISKGKNLPASGLNEFSFTHLINES